MRLSSMKVLNQHEMDGIHAAALRILEEVGFGTNSSEVAELARQAGFRMSNGTCRVLHKAVERALGSVPPRFRLYDPKGDSFREIGAGEPLFFSGHQAVFVHDFGVEHVRPGNRDDVLQFVITANALDAIDGIAVPVYPQEVPRPAALVHAMEVMLSHTRKPMFFAPEREDDFQTICALARLATKSEDLGRRPCLIAQPSPISPLFWVDGSSQCIIAAARMGVPCVSLHQIIPGMSGPVTLAGTLALHHAEFLLSLVIMQLVNPGAPVIYPGAWVTFDMAGGGIDIGAPEKYLLSIASVQMARYLHVPCMAAGPDTNAHTLDLQNGAEKSLSGAADAFAKTDIIVNAGMFSNALTVSLEQLVIDAELISMYRRMLRGIEVSEESIALDVIERVGIKGEYLSDPHTLQFFRTELWDTGKSLFQRDKMDKWKAQGGREVAELAHDRVARILAESAQPFVDAGIGQKMRGVVADFESRHR